MRPRIIAEDRHRRLSHDSRGVLSYKYVAYRHSPDIVCCFHLLSEVGAKYQPWFRRQLVRHHIKVEVRELPEYPHVAEFIG